MRKTADQVAELFSDGQAFDRLITRRQANWLWDQWTQENDGIYHKDISGTFEGFVWYAARLKHGAARLTVKKLEISSKPKFHEWIADRDMDLAEITLDLNKFMELQNEYRELYP